MSADNPPTYYFTGINFNSSFYEPPGTSVLINQLNPVQLVDAPLPVNVNPATPARTISVEPNAVSTVNITEGDVAPIYGVPKVTVPGVEAL